MVSKNVHQRLKSILVDQLNFRLSIEHIQEDISLYGKGLGLDSLDVVSLVTRLEEEFDIFFEAEEVGPSVETVGSLLLAVQQKIHQNGSATDGNEDA